jgi:hypothetical protein
VTDRNWDAELAKIDRQLASLSDEALRQGVERPAVPAGAAPAAGPRQRTAVGPAGATGGVGGAAAPAEAWHGWARTAVAVAAAAGLWYWPWPGVCGPPVMGLVGAAGGVMLLGGWSAAGTWRHRQGVLHVLSLLALVWGGVVAARDVLPRVGYAIPTAAHPATWQCEVAPPSPTLPAGSPLALVRSLLFTA